MVLESRRKKAINGYRDVSLETIEQAENAIGVKFPLEFKHVLVGKKTDGGTLEESAFLVPFPRKRQFYGSGLGAFLWFDPEYKNNIVNSHFDPPEYFPKGLVAFAEDGGGDYICFDYRADPTTDNPPIVYWAHEFEENEGVTPLAENFEAFLAMLLSDEEASAKLAELNAQA